MRKVYTNALFFALVIVACKSSTDRNSFESNWNSNDVRTWIGPEYWSNPMQDWQVEKGRLICNFAGPDRSVHLLPYSIENSTGNLETSLIVGIPSATMETGATGWAGFLIGARGEFNDYRDNAVYGKGLLAGITTNGNLFIENIKALNDDADVPEFQQLLSSEGITLHLSAKPQDKDNSKIILTAYKNGTKIVLKEITYTVPGEDLHGNLAIKSHLTGDKEKLRSEAGFWFEKWNASGTKLAYHPDRNFGPVLFTLFTLSKNVMKLTAQMPPLAMSDAKSVSLEIRSGDKGWKKIAEAPIDPMARTATFRLENWESGSDIPYRVTYNWGPDGKITRDWYYEGVIKKDPVEKNEIVVAAFTGNNDLGFPNTEVTEHVLQHKPDLLVYTGDQIYEPRGGFGNTIEPLDKATLDYLRKWYMFGWEYGSMLKDIPSVCFPDDHDMYHGNVWGCGGKAAKRSDDVKAWQDDGGYKMPPEWVNMVQRTQTSHMPDPYDPTPVLQNISVYYADMHLGGISFALIEDRKWKSAPKALLPVKLKVVNGWAESSRFIDPVILDVPAELLGTRQLNFLDKWAGDWSDKTIIKSVISQTLFCTVATLPDSAQSDVVVSALRITKKDEYPPNDIPTQDMDSDGWPKKGRDEAVRVIRKAFALHICGDQHLASSVRYGVDDWGDGSYAICVPSISNYFPRRWFPESPGKNQKPGDQKNIGDFTDGFGNKMTVLAVANPVISGLKPSKLYDRSAGYGIIRFNKKTRETEIANWPRQTDPSQQGAKPYDGWPIRFSQYDNYARKAEAWLPEFKITGTDLPPVIKITNEATGELVYAVRIKDYSFRPKVFAKGKYTVETGEPGTSQWKTIKGIPSVTEADTATIRVKL